MGDNCTRFAEEQSRPWRVNVSAKAAQPVRTRAQGGAGPREKPGAGVHGGSPVPAAEPLQLQLRAVELRQADEEAGERALGRRSGWVYVGGTAACPVHPTDPSSAASDARGKPWPPGPQAPEGQATPELNGDLRSPRLLSCPA